MNSIVSVRLIVLGLVAGLLILASPLAVFAHDARPIVIELVQDKEFTVATIIKAPNVIAPNYHPQLVMPDSCKRSGESLVEYAGDAYWHEYSYACKAVLSGKTLGIRFPAFNPSLSTLFRVRLANGVSITKVLSPGKREWLVPTEPSSVVVAKEYLYLGMTHIWRGLDHLLFVVCLLFLAVTPKKVLMTITGFTLAHSLTLALSTLGYLRLSIGAVEAIIALSIVFLVVEIVKGKRDSLAWRRPIVVAGLFGLVHGLGFASALTEIGLPQLDRFAALLFFNLGVEVGQLIFIAVLWILVYFLYQRVLAPKSRFSHPMLRLAGLYVIGILSAYWFVERSLPILAYA